MHCVYGLIGYRISTGLRTNDGQLPSVLRFVPIWGLFTLLRYGPLFSDMSALL